MICAPEAFSNTNESITDSDTIVPHTSPFCSHVSNYEVIMSVTLDNGYWFLLSEIQASTPSVYSSSKTVRGRN